ncbi:tellurite resistance TerB family protein [Aureimonas leprariae]|uniref:Tellurite resistance TerB family protein n=1 Tax=Plantimonas leprariae TaxID=2615207 RepID=A0A7V7TXP2_9HYPH|nr:tellurite resistance TerB family protein [Aureimonas leprariae]KAB0681201.1 tellurite resistance TerB family protein [Aureimonas leprariae]
MIDVQKLLGQFLGQQGQTDRPGGASPYPPQARGGSGIEAQLGKLMGGPAGAAVSGALASGLARQLFKGKGLGKMGGSAVKLGGAALVAGLAYKAWQSYQANGQGGARLPSGGQGSHELPSPVGTPFLPEGHEDHRARLMLSAMIAAAKADGTIDAAEQEAIFGRLDEAGLDAEEKGFLMDEMRRPLSIDELAAKVGGPEEAAEVYTASVLAIDPDHPAERAYLEALARRLGIDPALVAEIRRTTDAATA